MNIEEFRGRYPDVVLLDSKNIEQLTDYLSKRNFLDINESIINAKKIGDGNMNYTCRVTTNQRSFILKQSRPWVEKYPTIEAPWDRVIREYRFYDCVRNSEEVSNLMPVAFNIDPISRIFISEDLGETGDFTDLYKGKGISNDEVAVLAKWLSSLHQIKFSDEIKSSLRNRDMRELNHEHIFNFPLNKLNGLDLDQITPGLRDIADQYCQDEKYVNSIKELGKNYLSDGDILLHGDYFPGSWLRTQNGIKIIDPEFCFFGSAEFDVGVVIAHLNLASQKNEQIEYFQNEYIANKSFNISLARQFTGVEIMRRLIGVAQLPLSLNIENKIELLNLSRNLLVE